MRWSVVYLLVATMSICVLTPSCESTTEHARKAPKERARLVVVSYGGGAYQESHIKAFIRPFDSVRNTTTESVVWGAEYGRLSEMVRSQDIHWDVVEVTAAQFARGLRDDLFARIDPPIGDAVFSPLAGGPGPHAKGVPNVYWSTVLAYRKESFGIGPSTWADFWDVDRFPGARALYDSPRGNLEFALLASGVPRDRLYPLDLDRAFSKLDELRPHVRVWWSDGTEPVRLLLNGQVAISSAWSGRIFASEQARQEIGYSWTGAAHELDYWVIPKGARNSQLASEFVRFASSPEPMSEQAKLTAYGPANARALALVPAEVLPHLPTAEQNWAVSFVIDAAWWASHEDTVMTRWIQWRNR